MSTLAELTDDKLTLVNKALRLARRILAGNPPPEDLTDLNQTILELTREQTRLEALLEALRRRPSVTPPAPSQVAEIKALTSAVDAAIAATTTARDAIVVGTRVLTAVEKSGVA
jgi:hypothetical protein